MPQIAGANEVWSQCRVKELKQWPSGKIEGSVARAEGTEAGILRGARFLDSLVCLGRWG